MFDLKEALINAIEDGCDYDELREIIEDHEEEALLDDEPTELEMIKEELGYVIADYLNELCRGQQGISDEVLNDIVRQCQSVEDNPEMLDDLDEAVLKLIRTMSFVNTLKDKYKTEEDVDGASDEEVAEDLGKILSCLFE